MRRERKRTALIADIPMKANRVLNLILVGIVLIILRVWYLGVIQHEERLEDSKKPQVKVAIEPAKRGTIRDRYNVPLALNKVQYNATIVYAPIRDIPTKGGKRKDYITKLAHLLGNELQTDPLRIEDLIHSKASFFSHLPFVLKEDISEKEYYRLKMLEKDFPGVSMLRLPRREYPKGRVGADVIGYLGAISRDEYNDVLDEIKTLETFLESWDAGIEIALPEGFSNEKEVRGRLMDLIEHAYGINDYVGKTGVEGYYEENLRGFHGKKTYFSDSKGNYLRELTSREPLSGQRILLSISADLQEFCETLLIQNEKVRKPRLSNVSPDLLKKVGDKEPWIKGGAIVALDPISGDLLALASFPRFDPNDFIAKRNGNIRRWFESESYIAEVWDEKRPLEKEIFDYQKRMCCDEGVKISWEQFLKMILPSTSPVTDSLRRIGSIERAIELQNDFQKMLQITGEKDVYSFFKEGYKTCSDSEFLKIKKRTDLFLGSIENDHEKVLLLDLCQVAVDGEKFSERLLDKIGTQSISQYKEASGAMVSVKESVKKMATDLFHEVTFLPWREKNSKEFLKQKRKEEKEAGVRNPKPYIDILDEQERKFFHTFWETYQWDLLEAFLNGKKSDNANLKPYVDYFNQWQKEIVKGAHQAAIWFPSYQIVKKATERLTEPIEYYKTLRSYHDLTRPLLGKYRHIRKTEGKQLEKNLAAAFYPLYGYGYGRSFAYRQAATQGSIFKLVTSYAALAQLYRQHGSGLNMYQMNPMDMDDKNFQQGKNKYVGYNHEGTPIPQLYKGGRLPRSPSTGKGKLNLIRAIELSSNPYFALLAGDFLKSPEDLTQAAQLFSYGEKTGVDLPYEISGKVPKDVSFNRTGLYAMAIGQHTLVVTPLQTAVMLATIANGGKVLKPKIVRMIAGETPKREELVFGDIVIPISNEVKREVMMPPIIREILLESMHRVVLKNQSSGLGELARLYKKHPEAIKDYIAFRDDLLGKSSTSESMEYLDLDQETGTNLYNHIWFGGVVFNHEEDSHKFVFKDRFGVPELVVVVYLRCGGWGKDAAPLAAQVAAKWREIKHQHDLKL